MKSNQRKLKFIAAAFFIILLVILNSNNYLESFKNKFSHFFYYPEVIASKAVFFTKDRFKFIFDARKAYSDKMELIDEKNSLLKQVSDLKEADNENKILRGILNLPLAKGHSLIDGNVIGKGFYNFSDYLLIARGSNDGVKEGMVAVDKNGFYIGKVAEVLADTAGIMLITDSRSAVGVIDQETRVQGLAKNDRNIGFYLDMVPQDSNIKEGDLIISSPVGASGDSFPLAKVIFVEKYPNKAFQKIKLSALADLRNIEKVFILLN